MVITLDTKELDKYGLTPNEFVLLYKLNYARFAENYTEDDLKALIEKGFVRAHDLSTTELGLELISPKYDEAWERAFLEFWSIYPNSVGDRVLKTEKSNTRLANECRKKFKKSCYNKIENSSNVIKALQNQIKLLKGTASWNYFQTVEAWLNQNTWEKYIEIEEKEERLTGI